MTNITKSNIISIMESVLREQGTGETMSLFDALMDDMLARLPLLAEDNLATRTQRIVEVAKAINVWVRDSPECYLILTSQYDAVKESVDNSFVGNKEYQEPLAVFVSRATYCELRKADTFKELTDELFAYLMA